MTQLSQHIAQQAIIDTHEHLETEAVYLAHRPDIINALFGNNAYIQHDLVSAGMSYVDLEAALDRTNPDIAERWRLIAPHWQHCQSTGYAEAVSLSAHALYHIEHLDAQALVAAQSLHAQYLVAGQHAAILEHKAGIVQVQIDAFTWGKPEHADPAPLYEYDLNVCTLVNGTVDLDELGQRTGIVINTLQEYGDAIDGLFRRYAAQSVAVKSQHAYDRTLAWHAVDNDTAATILQKKLWGTQLTAAERVQLGDWSMGRIAEHAGTYHLPFKIHTGHHAGNGAMPIDWVRPGQLCELLKQHRNTRFVLMHIGYPYQHELLSMAKHYANVYVDLCWAWSINPLASQDFVRQWIHSVPINKLLGFGGDAFYPTQSVGFALQTRKWLTATLQKELNDELLSPAQAMHIATRLLHDNARELFQHHEHRMQNRTSRIYRYTTH